MINEIKISVSATFAVGLLTAVLAHGTGLITIGCVLAIGAFVIVVALTQKLRGENVMAGLFLVGIYLAVSHADPVFTQVGIALASGVFTIALRRAIRHSATQG
jgi:hypothetical protein